MSEHRVKYEVVIRKINDNEFLAKLMARNVYPQLSKWYVMKSNVFTSKQLVQFVEICKKQKMDIDIRRVDEAH